VPALAKKLIDIPFAAGMDQKADPRWLDPGSQTSVINARFVKKNAVQTRYGFNALSKGITGGGTLASTQRLAAYKSEVVSIDGDWLYSYSPTQGTHVKKTRVSECVGYRTGISSSTTTVSCPDVAELGGYRVFVWQGSFPGPNDTGLQANFNGTIYASVLDIATNSFILSGVPLNSTSVPTASSPRVTFTTNSGNGVTQANVFWYEGGNIYNCAWNPASPGGFTTATIILSNCLAQFDVCPFVNDASGAVFLTVEYNFGINPINIWLFRPGFGLLTTATVSDTTAGNSAYASRADANDGNLWIAYGVGSIASTNTPVIHWVRVLVGGLGILPGTVRSFFVPAIPGAYTYGGAGTTGPITALGIERKDINNIWIVAGAWGTGAAPGFLSWHLVNTTVVVQNMAPQYNIYPTSRPFLRGSRLYCFSQLVAEFTTATSQQTQVLVDLMVDTGNGNFDTIRPVATIGPRISGYTPCHLEGHVSSVTNVGNPNATVYNTCGGIIISSGLSIRLSLVQATFDFTHPGRWQNFEVGDSLFVSGGIPSYYDGQLLVEAGYFMRPSLPLLTGVGSAGGALTPANTYSYVWIYEWLDARSQVHRSQASPVVPVVLGANTATTWTVPYLTIGARGSPGSLGAAYSATNAKLPALIPYRTTIISAAMSADLFRALGGAGLADSVPTSPVSLYNVLIPGNVQYSNYTDILADGTIATNAVWLGSADIGVVEPQLPPSFVAAWSYNGRILGVGDDRTTVWYSTKSIQGEVPRFNDLFTFPVLNMLGPLTAGAQMDDKCILFSANKIAYFTGDGPNDTNQQNDFSAISFVQSDVGCIDPRSVVTTPMGVMFQSSRGLYLLSRSLEVSYIGKAIEDTLSAYPTITSAVLVAAQNEVRFTLNNAAGTLGYTARYNFLLDAWSLDSIFDSDTSTQQKAYLTAAYCNGTYYCATVGGQIYQENTALNTDAGTFVPLSVESAWLKPNGIAGWGRFWRFFATAERLDPADLQMQIAYDYSPTYTDSITWTAARIGEFPTPIVQVQMMGSRQKTEAIRLKLSTATPTGGAFITTGQGLNLIAISAEVGVMQGGYRLPAVQRG
jgi:hypothetical protein